MSTGREVSIAPLYWMCHEAVRGGVQCLGVEPVIGTESGAIVGRVEEQAARADAKVALVAHGRDTAHRTKVLK